MPHLQITWVEGRSAEQKRDCRKNNNGIDRRSESEEKEHSFGVP